MMIRLYVVGGGKVKEVKRTQTKERVVGLARRVFEGRVARENEECGVTQQRVSSGAQQTLRSYNFARLCKHRKFSEVMNQHMHPNQWL